MLAGKEGQLFLVRVLNRVCAAGTIFGFGEKLILVPDESGLSRIPSLFHYVVSGTMLEQVDGPFTLPPDFGARVVIGDSEVLALWPGARMAMFEATARALASIRLTNPWRKFS